MTSESLAQLIAEVCIPSLVTSANKVDSAGNDSFWVQAGDRNAEHLVFCIGGPFGHGNDLRAQADKIVKLSDMVLNHQVHCLLTVESTYTLA